MFKVIFINIFILLLPPGCRNQSRPSEGRQSRQEKNTTTSPTHFYTSFRFVLRPTNKTMVYRKRLVKGIVSRDLGRLKMILLGRLEVFNVSLKVFLLAFSSRAFKNACLSSASFPQNVSNINTVPGTTKSLADCQEVLCTAKSLAVCQKVLRTAKSLAYCQKSCGLPKSLADCQKVLRTAKSLMDCQKVLWTAKSLADCQKSCGLPKSLADCQKVLQ